MKKRLISLLFFLIISFSLFGEESTHQLKSGDFGITAIMDVGSVWIGGIYHLSPSFALRPSLEIYRVGSKYLDNLANTTDEVTYFAYGIDMDVLYYIPIANNYFIYFGPSVGYYSNSENTDWDDGYKTEETKSQIRIGVLIGSQFMVSNHFGLIADIGIGYMYEKNTSVEKDPSGNKDIDTEDTHSMINTIGASLGVVFYF